MRSIADEIPLVKRQDGFSLVEALVAIAILAIVMLGTASMLFNGLSTSAGSNNRYMGVATAQARVEELMKRPFANLSSHLTPAVTSCNGVNFSTKWRVSSLSTNSVFINISTNWNDKTGRHGLYLPVVRSK